MAAGKLNIAQPDTDATAEKAPATATKAGREIVTTTIRFEKKLMQRLKMAALGREQSMQEMIESALAQMFERDCVKMPGLRK